MTTFVYRNGKVIEKGLASAKHASERATNVISDTMAETRHMADGNYYTSKSKFRKATRAAGCVEVGNDPQITKPRQPVRLDPVKRRDDIKRAIYELRNGRA